MSSLVQYFRLKRKFDSVVQASTTQHERESVHEKATVSCKIFFSIMMMFTRNKTTKNTCNSAPTRRNL